MEDRLAAIRFRIESEKVAAKESTIRHELSIIFSSPRAYPNTNQGYDRGGFTSTQGAGGFGVGRASKFNNDPKLFL